MLQPRLRASHLDRPGGVARGDRAGLPGTLRGEGLTFDEALEAVRALEAGVLEDIREGDVGAILGWGFAPWSGGPFGWLDMLGAERAVQIADALAETHGERFAAPALLRNMAAQGKSFYGTATARPAA